MFKLLGRISDNRDYLLKFWCIYGRNFCKLNYYITKATSF